MNASGLQIGAGARITEVQNSDGLGTSDTKLCTQGNVKAYVDNLLEGEGIQCYSVPSINGTGSSGKTSEVVLDFANEDVIWNFNVPNEIDVGENMVIAINFYRADAVADTISIKIYAASWATDGTDPWAWNIESGTVTILPACAGNRFQTYTYTFNGNFSPNDEGVFLIRMNEGGRTVTIYNMFVYWSVA